MTFFKAIAAVMGGAGATISSPWSNISFSSPTASGTNEDRTITGSGTVTDASGSIASLQYRINSGTWTDLGVAGSFSISSGQTLAWRVLSGGGNQSGTVAVRVNGVPLDDFTVTVTGF